MKTKLHKLLRTKNKEIAIILMSLLTLVSIAIFLSIHDQSWEWFYLVKNYKESLSLFPILTLMVCGYGIVVVGNVLQYTSRNNFASPLTLGILPAATLSVTILKIFGISSLLYSFFLGIGISILLIWLVLFITSKSNKNEIILMGLAVGLITMAINYLISHGTQNNNVSFVWFNNEHYIFVASKFHTFAYLIIAVSILSLITRRQLVLYWRSPEKAFALGVNIRLLVMANYLFAIVMSIAIVFLIGEIAFLGIAIPNITRLILKTDNLLINVVLGSVIAIPLLIISMVVADIFSLNFQLLTTIVCTPIFVITLLRWKRGAYVK